MTLKGVIGEIKSMYLETFSANAFTTNIKKPIISISFDDVPLSAFLNGAPQLNEYGFKGTFYSCLGLTGELANSHLTEKELTILESQGHEVGCHTYSHYKLSEGNAKGLAEDARVNRDALFKATEQTGPLSFSYPFGEVNFSEKRLLSEHYSSMRSTRWGINRGRIDLSCLRAVPLYEHDNIDLFFQRWILSAQEKPGWLIFYTHGVSSQPGSYDIGLKSFSRLLSYIKEQNIDVLPVSKAVQSITDQ